MKNLRWWYFLVLLLHSLPWLALVGVGCLWLWERPWGLLTWGVASAITLISGTFLLKRIRSQNASIPKPITHIPQKFTEAEPDPDWPPQAVAAWRSVLKLAERQRKRPFDSTDMEAYWKLFYEVIETVARQYHRNRDDPALEIPAPQVLRTMELVAADLRRAISENIPGSHILTLGDFRRLQRWKTLGQRAYFLYRMVSFGINPVTAAVREIRGTATNQVIATSAEDFREWIVDFAIRKTGYYAIGLYGEHQPEEDLKPESLPTTLSLADMEASETAKEKTSQRLSQEPVRILVIGRRGGGKTSLVAELTGTTTIAPGVAHSRNSTFWDTRPPAPTLFDPQNISSYPGKSGESDVSVSTERTGDTDSVERGEQLVIVELPGYTSRDNAWKKTVGEIGQADIVLLVCSALVKTDGPETLWMERFKEWTAEHPERHAPKLIVAMTKAGRLAELEQESLSDDRLLSLIRERMRRLRQNLQIPTSTPILPVDVTADHVAGIREPDGLRAVILGSLDEARRVRKYRCLRLRKTKENGLRRIARQFRSGFGLATAISATVLKRVVHQKTESEKGGRNAEEWSGETEEKNRTKESGGT
ncbi:MAG: hypothetical protein Q4C47_06330 [Planctomycetia bacterium]|nr:hypothetical protein [Planctomycetia bacterium]